MSFVVVWLCLLFMFPGITLAGTGILMLSLVGILWCTTCRLVSRTGRPWAEITMEYRTGAGNSDGKKNGKIASLE